MSAPSRSQWQAWHEPYDQPGSYLSRRLAVVQAHLAAEVDRVAPGPVRLVSACAGQARDVVGALTAHPRRDDVVGRLVELDPGNADVAAAAVRKAGLAGIDVVQGDASTTDAYVGAVPADVVLMCGVFGNITDDDIRRSIGMLPQLCAGGAAVIWTRHRRPPDLTPSVRRWFDESGFDEVAFEAPEDHLFGVGVHRLVAAPRPLQPGQQLFQFVGDDH